MRRRLLLPLLILLALAGSAAAHQSSVTYSRVQVGDDGTIDYTLLINSRDLYEALGLEQDRDASNDEIRAGEQKLTDYVFDRLKVGAGEGVACKRETRGLTIVEQSDRFAQLRFVVKCPPQPERITISYGLFFELDKGHVGMLQVTHHGKTISRELKKGVQTFEWQLRVTEPIPFSVRLTQSAAGGWKLEPLLDEVKSRIAITSDGGAKCEIEAGGGDLGLNPIDLKYLVRCPKAFGSLHFAVDFEEFGPKSDAPVGSLVVRHGEQTSTFELPHGRAQFEWKLGGGPSSMTLGDFVREGMKHIYTGYDHICFLIGLLLVAVVRRHGRRGAIAAPWRIAVSYVLKTVTAFTVAHSITLILSALGVISLSSRIVEAAIAASIVYVAAENLWVREPDNRWILAFVFGLVHGLGFASSLKPMLPPQGLVVPLLMLNVGVEIGQLTIVIVLMPALGLIAKRSPILYRQIVVIGGSALVGLFGMLWLVDRLFHVRTISRFLG